jgi:colicin import membrane protein
MKPIYLLWLCLLCMPAVAQVKDAPRPINNAAERARIETERAKEKLRFEKAEEYCYQRFAVNDCVRDVAVQRRKTLDELRRQEIILNDTDRKLRAGEQLRQLDEKKAAAARLPASAAPRADRLPKVPAAEQEQAQEKAYQEKLQKAQERKVERDQKQAEKKGPPSRPLPVPP